ncbi:hypothetical protein AAFC00_003961 [Neodothiora populina]|uniref:Cytochrome P450 monooxygenase n=2 Tax=Neodothiora populina TaxID=2781224 RepID=A0ABR3PIF8_9PEZI
MSDLHESYGDVVRYTPNEVSFISGETAWADIYGFRTGRNKGTGSFEKDRVWYAPSVDDVDSMVRAHGAHHGRQRRILSHAFSTQALKQQEGLVMQYVDLLVSRLKEVTSRSDAAVDMSKWYNWTTFDIISDLTFGKSLGCLADLATHPYVDLIMNFIKAFGMYYVQSYWPWVNYLGSFVVDPSIAAKGKEADDWFRSQTHKRLADQTRRPDFMHMILAHRYDYGQGEGISDGEIVSNAANLLAAGTDTTSIVLSTATFMMLTRPEESSKLKAEVRERFTSSDEITVDAASQLPYLNAFITEAMRHKPPVPAGFVRKVPLGGAEISGYHIPGNCDASVSVSQYAAYHSARNFALPNSFIPERWIEGADSRFASDNKATFQPFSFGPRNCIGKNLAWMEMRMLLAKMVVNFDFEMDERSKSWDTDMPVLALWQRPELFVKVKEVKRASGSTLPL